MKIQIDGLEDERFKRPLQNIANLFFEETDIFLDQDSDADIKVEILLVIKENTVTVSAALVKSGDSEVYKAAYSKEIEEGLSEKDFFTKVKNAVSHVYLSVLQNFTGIYQKWGVLTGVRPTKLMHKKVRMGIDRELAHSQLKEE